MVIIQSKSLTKLLTTNKKLFTSEQNLILLAPSPSSPQLYVVIIFQGYFAAQ